MHMRVINVSMQGKNILVVIPELPLSKIPGRVSDSFRISTLWHGQHQVSGIPGIGSAFPAVLRPFLVNLLYRCLSLDNFSPLVLKL